VRGATFPGVTRPDFLHPFARPAARADQFVTIVRGEGAAVFDGDGNRYVDALAGLWFCEVGHGRAEIAEAVGAQLRELETFHCFDIFTNEPADALCRRLAGLSPVPGSRVFLTNSGSEAVDSAIKLARLTFDRRGEPERHLVVGRRHAYHGVTYGGLSVMGLPLNTRGWGPLVGGVHAIEHDELGSAEALFAEHGEHIAAVIAEPVMGAGGVHPPGPGYLQGLRDLCDAHGALLILDEVITGFGRLGHWWGSDRFGVQADLVTFAKGVTSGYQPLGGVLVGHRVLDALEADDDFVLRTGHTYSGHPAACRAALTNIDIIARERLADRAESVIGPWFASRLAAMLTEGLIAESRGLSGIWAIDMVDGVSAVDVRDDLLGHGVVVRPLGTATIGLCPPLVIDEEDLARITDGLTTVLRGHVRSRTP
jgi:putrescine---pyruvate transaminase